ncbi:hypothetical protein [Entomobacter blattae]|uniref:hypothetical protein n=1 Tax=Entomobacter blattae TaxID=2762277 RepID=UPI00193B51F9|nr:hypothetical protein [Entomobacter blattae]
MTIEMDTAINNTIDAIKFNEDATGDVTHNDILNAIIKSAIDTKPLSTVGITTKEQLA